MRRVSTLNFTFAIFMASSFFFSKPIALRAIVGKFIMLADALEEDPGDLFDEIVAIYRNSKS